MHHQVHYNVNYLSNNIFDHMPVNIGQAEVAPLVSISEFPMVNPKQVQDGGIKVVYMHGILRPMMLIWLNYITVTVS